MKIGSYSDTHFRENGPFNPFNKISTAEDSHGGLTHELENTIKGCKFVAAMIRKTKPDIVINKGDTYHDMRNVPTRVLKAVSIGLGYIDSACKEVGAEHNIIAGNHDIVTFAAGIPVSSIDILKGYYDNVIIEPQLRDGILYIPYVHEQARFISTVADNPSAKIAYTHYECQGAKLETGKECESFITSKSKFPVVSGHIHRKQTIRDWNFPGSLVQNRFGDIDPSVIGGYHLVEMEGDKVTSQKTYQNNFSRHYISITANSEKELKEQLSNLINHPLDFIYRVKSTLPYDSVNKLVTSIYEGEYSYIPLMKRQLSEDVKNKTVPTNLAEDSLLKNHVLRNNPDAMDDLEELIKEVSNANAT